MDTQQVVISNIVHDLGTKGPITVPEVRGTVMEKIVVSARNCQAFFVELFQTKKLVIDNQLSITPESPSG